MFLGADAHSQCNWDKLNFDAEFANLLSTSNTRDKARLLAVLVRSQQRLVTRNANLLVWSSAPK